MENLNDYQYSDEELKEMGYSENCHLPLALTKKDMEKFLYLEFPSEKEWNEFKEKYKRGEYKIEIQLF